MSEQTQPSFTIPPKPTDNLFLAIFPDANTAEPIAQLAQQLRTRCGLRGKQLAADRFHMTLYSFNVLEADLQAVSKACAAAAASTPPFEVGLDRALSFASHASNRPFVLRSSNDSAALQEFFKSLGAELRDCGFSSRGKLKFTPHITLLFDKQIIAKQSIDPVSWTANEFFLVHSLVGESRYIRLARWALHGSPAQGVFRLL